MTTTSKATTSKATTSKATTSTTTITLTAWQRMILAAVAAGEVTMVRPVASKAFADWYRPGAKPQHRTPTHTLNQLVEAGLVRVRLDGTTICTRAGRALTNLMTRQ